jgi:transcriptional regulator with XRE-family HTH domain
MPGDPKLGARIRTARTEKGWKQKHLAAQVSVEPITVSRWERGATTPDLDVLGLVAEATGKPLSFFVDEQPAPSRSLDDAVARVEEAANRIGEEGARIADALEELRDELRRLRAGS